MAKQKKVKSLRHHFVSLMVFLGASFLALSVFILAMGAIYGQTQNQALLIVMIIITIVAVVGLGVTLFFIGKSLRHKYVDVMMGVTNDNLKQINSGSADLKFYPEEGIEEFSLLNDEIRNVRGALKNATFIFGELNYDNFEFVPFEGVEGAYELERFQKQLSNVIAASMNFRNVIAEVYYELPEEEFLTNEELNQIVSNIKKRFSVYDGLIFFIPKDRKSVYAYLPRIDSFTSLRDQFDTLAYSCAVSKNTINGSLSLMPHYSIVAYPFSAVHELFPDLRYAKRQNKVSNLYLPNRLHSLGDVNIGKNAMEFNQMSKILYNISAIEANPRNKQDVRKSISACLTSLINELHFECGGIIAYDQEIGGYIVKDHVGSEAVMKLGTPIDPEFISTLTSNQDADHSFYFSRREKTGKSMGKLADRLGVKSGFLFTMMKEGEVVGTIYFLNRESETRLDSYLQESLAAACYHIASSYAIGEVMESSVEAKRQFEALLSSTDSAFYRIDKSTHSILAFSPFLKRLHPSLAIGEPCHKVLHGLAGPCPDCPLIKGKKKVYTTSKGRMYQVSLTLDVKRANVHTLLIQKIKTENDSTNRFYNELLISSFQTLFEEVISHYAVGDNGYVLILRIANHSELVGKYGSEGFLLILRNLIASMNGLGVQYDNLFRYDDKSLALLLPAVGQTDIINRCEEIFRLTKNLTYEGEERYDLSIDYMPMNYPQGYAGAEDFFRHVTRDVTQRKLTRGHDFIYFDDTDYVRPASRREFMLSVIEEQFGKETFRVELQPMVKAKTKKIFGAEILLRIQDEYRHIVFNPVELVQVAAENGKIPLITRALLRFVASFYDSVGAATFKAMGFTKLALNTDVSLFDDANFEEDFANLLKEHNLPSTFIALEMAEGDIAHHLNEIVEKMKMLKKFNVSLVVDQYSGRNLSIDDLARLGFDKIKVGRNVVHNIDTDQGKLASITSLLQEAKAKGIDAAIVGVENLDQYELLMKINPELEMQGYYFYKPLEKAALLDAMRLNKAK